MSVLGPETGAAGGAEERANAAVESGWNAGTRPESGVRRIERTTASRPGSNPWSSSPSLTAMRTIAFHRPDANRPVGFDDARDRGVPGGMWKSITLVLHLPAPNAPHHFFRLARHPLPGL